jgi:hypothetical protein
MANNTKEFSWGVVKDTKTDNDWELMQQDRKAQEQWDANEREVERRQRKELLEKDPDAILKMERYAIWHCHPRCGFKVDRRDEGAIQEHKSQCGYCIEDREEREAQKQAVVDGRSSMRFILSSIQRAKEEIETQKRKIQREEKEKQENWQLVVQMAQSKIEELQNTIKRELSEREKLLNDEPNETKRNAAREMYNNEYLNLSDKDRRNVYLYDKPL